VRLQHYDAHKAYQAAAPVKIAMSGPLTTDDDKLMMGSFILAQADSRRAIEQFVADDPFNKAGIWKQIDLNQLLNLAKSGQRHLISQNGL
jgi:uncharacterized protein YciI